jgi:hypothetical protein
LTNRLIPFIVDFHSETERHGKESYSGLHAQEHSFKGFPDMKRNFRLFTFATFLPAILLVWISPAWGVELSIPEVSIESGKTAEIPLLIDRIDNLAGVKLVIRYDKELLTYKKGVRGQKTSSLMHVVNDKNPGRLVIVMAGARGIKG